MKLKIIYFYIGKINLLIIFFSIINLFYCFYFDFKTNLKAYFFTFLISLLFYLSTLKIKVDDKKLRTETLIFFSIAGWIILPFIMSIPFWLGGYSSFLNSYFESISGFTSFGASIFFEQINLLDSPILLWRSSTQLVGTIFFIMTIILVLGSRELNLYPLKFITRKKEPISFSLNFKNIFHNTIYAYSIIFFISLFFLNFTDLRMLDKFNLSLTIISTGGFQTSEIILNNYEKVIISFLFILSSLNIFLILRILRINNTYNFYEDRSFLYLLLFLFIILYIFGTNVSISDKLLYLSSSISNSGINFTNNYNKNIVFILLSASFFGGCLISSSSGFKVSRILIIFNKIYFELLRLLSPSAVINLSIFKSNEKIKTSDFYSCCLLLLLYLVLFISYSFLLTFENISFENSFLTSFLITFNTLPSTMYMSESVNFTKFSDLSLVLTILILIFSKITPLSLIALIKYKFIK
tara:strand:+ start:3035 stop:4435 length:1401 start_codon:yes stop_codon:yes gene_type:complete